ncbi:PHD finger-containing protein [Phytophthora ramorum]|uniref:PHD finger-containing protein n=1 Tax=Phytophthora ramorum TaxID=164328 RepID=UPI0030B7D763|nr:PHD finger-containing protein [Phytophthora ramorum]
MADSDASSGSSSSSSSDSVLIRVPLDQKRRKKLRAQLQEDQRRLQASHGPFPNQTQRFTAIKAESDVDRSKGEHICVVCEQEGEHLVVCGGPCISAFHPGCLPPDSGATEAQDEAWLCPSCRNKTHACFHCKRTGVEMLKDEAASASSSDPSQRAVRKCRALSCGKFYHQDCITQFPLARIAINTHFICPLHTCAGCNQSGAQQEAVRCMRCPVAYHAKCLPPNCVRQISSKLIICPKHAGESWKESEEKAVKVAPPKQLSQVQVENDEEAMSEASAVSASSARRKEKREKRDKKDKKKKKKKKKKDKHKRESLASLGDDEQEHEDGKKRKRSKRESLDADGSTSAAVRGGKGSPLTLSSRRTESNAAAVTPSAGVTDAGVPRSPTSSLALFESPATATKRIQERLVEALGQSDDDDSDVSSASPSLNKRRSSNQITSSQGELSSTADGTSHEARAVVKEERPTVPSSKIEQGEEKTNSPVPSSPVPDSPQGDKDWLEARSSAEEQSPDVKSERKKERRKEAGDGTNADRADQREQSFNSELRLEIPKSPSASALIPSSSGAATAGLTLKHVPSDGDDDDDDRPGGSATPNTDATPRTPKAGRTIGLGKKRKKNKAKREAHRALKRGASEEEEEEENSEAKWVQCDSCKKWRTVPRDFNLDAMPKHWYCNMNTWDVRFASCAVAEEVLKLNPSPQADKRKNKVKTKSRSILPSTGDDGGYASSSGSGPLKRHGGSQKGSVTDMIALEEKEKKSSKNKDKAKKRKMTKQLKEKYREVKWVQCESTQCGKWRVVPASINFDRLPAVWYCHLNTWAPELAKCSAPNPSEVDVFLLKQAKKEATGSGRPSKKPRSAASTADAAPAASVSVTPGGGITPTSSASDLTSLGRSNSFKHGKSSKATVSGTGSGASTTGGGSSNAEGANSNSSNNPEGNGGGHSSKGGRGRSTGNTTTTGIKKTVLEWAQCEKCNKWRKLPQHIKSSTLPDKWYCSMNHWDLSHAKCSVPEEADQEPLPLPPHPGSHWHKGGHRGQRPRRGKLSYSELLYGSTGQLRKAYTSESSTLSFEYEDSTYQRDDQYKHSSMYVSPAAIAAAATMAGWSGSDRVNRETNCCNESRTADVSKVDALAAATPPQASVDRVAALVLKSMDLRRRRSVTELFDAVNSTAETGTSGLASLAMVTAALGQLEHRGLVEKVDESSSDEGEEEPSQKRRKVEPLLFNGAFSVPTHYRKVPKRPLKASKCWKFGTNVVSLSLVKES